MNNAIGFKQLKRLFLIDAFGALLSAISLGIVLVRLEQYFGIPTDTLYFLAALPVLFAIYDFYSYFNVEKNLAENLKRIAIVNYGYCGLSIGLAIYHSASITSLGWLYIILEIIIVMSLASIELSAVKKHQAHAK